MGKDVVVVGAGVVGLTTAFWLSRAGANVHVVDRGPGPGLGTSFATAGMMTPNQANPWNSPGVLRSALASLVQRDAPLLLRLGSLPSFAGWGYEFVSQSRADAYRRNARRNFKFGQYSLRLHRQILGETGIQCSRCATGSLQIFQSEQSFIHARAITSLLAHEGLQSRCLNSPDLLALEPALVDCNFPIVGGIFFPEDDWGDPYQFCVQLAKGMEEAGVCFSYGVPIDGFEVNGDRVSAVRGPNTRIGGDAFVVAAASHSRWLLQRLGIAVPICPVKGYSITFDSRGLDGLPEVPLVHMDRKVALTSFGERFRIAGTAEFAGFSGRVERRRVEMLLGDAAQLFPSLASAPRETMRVWTGLRPVTPTGFPILGRRKANLFVNAGHGPLGWTFAAGSGRIVADLVTRGHHELASESLIAEAIAT